MKTANKVRVPLIVGVLAVLIVGLYISCVRKGNNSEPDPTDQKPISMLVSRDLEKNYPSTPKSVVTFYGDILKVLYKEEMSTEEYGKVVELLRGLFDEELLGYNTYDSYYLSLQAEIDQYKTNNMYVSDYEVESGYGIDYKTLKDGKDYAYVDAKIFVRSGKNSQTVYEEFTLRKDEEGNWKLLTWKTVEASKME